MYFQVLSLVRLIDLIYRFCCKLTSVLTIVFRCRFFFFNYPWMPAMQGVITFFVLANFTLATFMDPGVIPKGKYIGVP